MAEVSPGASSPCLILCSHFSERPPQGRPDAPSPHLASLLSQHTPVRHLSPWPPVPALVQETKASRWRNPVVESFPTGVPWREGPGWPAVDSLSSWAGSRVAGDPQSVTFVPEQPCVFPRGHTNTGVFCVCRDTGKAGGLAGGHLSSSS